MGQGKEKLEHRLELYSKFRRGWEL